MLFNFHFNLRANMSSNILHLIAIISCILVLLLLGQSDGNLAPNGANVCSRQVSFSQNYRKSIQVSMKMSYIEKCGFWNLGNCTRYRTAYQTRYTIATRTSYRKQYQCCKGWSQVGNQCTKAICTQPCVNGTCTKPDNCSCYSGYYGKLCDRDCPSHKWGSHCRHDCLCQNNAKCSPHTGICTCTPGWEGQYCDKPCDQGYYGDRCQYNCTCLNGGTCDRVSGNCTCAAGYQGQRCKTQCFSGWYGRNCALRCECQNGGSCDHVNGTCKCLPGYTGKSCERLCTDDIMGRKCQGNCACHNNATCSPLGFCNCTSGYTGMLCEKLCSSDINRCLRQCNCSRWGYCNPHSGLCSCQPGHIGTDCGTQCPNGKYGPGCTSNCKCQNNATCSKVDGSCDCLPGWTGIKCNNPCPTAYYGKNCQSKCSCANETSCDPVTGQCTCVGDWQGGFCNTSMTFDRESQSKDLDKVFLPSVLSSASFILIVIIVAVVLIECRRRRNSLRRKAIKDPPVSEQDGTKAESVVKKDTKSTRKRRGKQKRNSDVDIQLQAPFYDNFPIQNSEESHVVSVNTVTIETHYASLHKDGSLGNQDVYQSLERNLKDSQLTGMGFYGNQDNLQGFHGDYQSLSMQEKDSHVYQSLSFKSHSTSKVDSPQLYDNAPRESEAPAEPQYEIRPSEEGETYITVIS